jgi:hypothetical protein
VIPSHQYQRHATAALALALGFLSPNGCLQQIAANRFSTPQDVIAILLQGFVRHAWLFMNVCPVAHPLKPATIRMTRIILVR